MIVTTNCSQSTLHALIDANDLFRTQADILQRAPGGSVEDRIDYVKLASRARWLDAKKAYRPAIEFFDLDRAFASGENAFYALLRRKGFELQLTPKGFDQFYGHQGMILRRLGELQATCTCPVLFVAGACRDAYVRNDLQQLSTERDVFLFQFSRLSEFEPGELHTFAGILDLVEERIAHPAFYGIITRRQEGIALAEVRELDDFGNEVDGLVVQSAPEPDLIAPASEATAIPEPEPDGSLGRALLEALRDVDRDSLSRDSSQDAEDAVVGNDDQYADLLNESAVLGLRTSSEASVETDLEPLIVLIDAENLDADLWNILKGTGISVNRDSRPQWELLSQYLNEVWGEERVLVVPVLRHSSIAISGFASYLSSLGFKPLVINPQADRSVVDEAIIKLLEDMRSRAGDVMLLSSDGGYFDHLDQLRSSASGSERRVIVAGFLDRVSFKYREAEWLELLDVERDLQLFLVDLPNRYLPVDVDDFDANAFLEETGLFPKLEAA